MFAVNVTANYRLIRSLDLLLRQAEAGRAVFVSSSSSHSARPFWGALCRQQGGARGAGQELCRRDRHHARCKANVFYPGAVRTAMRAKAMPGEDPETLPHPPASRRAGS